MNEDIPTGGLRVIQNVEKLLGKSGKLRTYSEIDINLVEPGPWQPRQVFDQEKIDELAASIARSGQQEPILVMKQGGTYRIVSGERRYRALKQLDKPTIEALVLSPETTEAQLREIAIISNVQREDLDPFEEARAFRVLMEEHKHTLESLGRVLGKKKSTIHDVLLINTLPEQIREDFRLAGNRASKTLLVEVAREKDQAKQLALWAAIKSGEARTKQAVRERKKPAKTPSKNTIKQRYISEVRASAKRAKELADEGIDLTKDEFEAVLPDWDLIDAYMQEQRQKLQNQS